MNRGVIGVGVSEIEDIVVFNHWARFFLGDFLVEGFSVLFYGVFGVFVDGNLNHSFILDFLLWVVKVMKVRMLKGFFHANSIFRVKN